MARDMSIVSGDWSRSGGRSGEEGEALFPSELSPAGCCLCRAVRWKCVPHDCPPPPAGHTVTSRLRQHTCVYLAPRFKME